MWKKLSCVEIAPTNWLGIGARSVKKAIPAVTRVHFPPAEKSKVCSLSNGERGEKESWKALAGRPVPPGGELITAAPIRGPLVIDPLFAVTNSEQLDREWTAKGGDFHIFVRGNAVKRFCGEKTVAPFRRLLFLKCWTEPNWAGERERDRRGGQDRFRRPVTGVIWGPIQKEKCCLEKWLEIPYTKKRSKMGSLHMSQKQNGFSSHFSSQPFSLWIGPHLSESERARGGVYRQTDLCPSHAWCPPCSSRAAFETNFPLPSSADANDDGATSPVPSILPPPLSPSLHPTQKMSLKERKELSLPMLTETSGQSSTMHKLSLRME